MWLGWLVVGGSLVVVDVQNGSLGGSFTDLLGKLDWKEQEPQIGRGMKCFPPRGRDHLSYNACCIFM